MEVVLQYITVHDEAYHELLNFRNEWLRKPIGLSLFDEDLSVEQHDVIITLQQNNDIVGCVLLQKVDAQTYKLRQMAIDETLRGKGLGKILMEEAERYLIAQDVKNVVLHARQYAMGFYEQLGYQAYGDSFIEVTIPHIAMKKLLL